MRVYIHGYAYFVLDALSELRVVHEQLTTMGRGAKMTEGPKHRIRASSYLRSLIRHGIKHKRFAREYIWIQLI